MVVSSNPVIKMVGNPNSFLLLLVTKYRSSSSSSLPPKGFKPNTAREPLDRAGRLDFRLRHHFLGQQHSFAAAAFHESGLIWKGDRRVHCSLFRLNNFLSLFLISYYAWWLNNFVSLGTISWSCCGTIMPQSAISPDFTEIPAIENFIEFVRVFSFLLMSCKGLLGC